MFATEIYPKTWPFKDIFEETLQNSCPGQDSAVLRKISRTQNTYKVDLPRIVISRFMIPLL